jgi:hypothetical protein
VLPAFSASLSVGNTAAKVNAEASAGKVGAGNALPAPLNLDFLLVRDDNDSDALLLTDNSASLCVIVGASADGTFFAVIFTLAADSRLLSPAPHPPTFLSVSNGLVFGSGAAEVTCLADNTEGPPASLPDLALSLDHILFSILF